MALAQIHRPGVDEVDGADLVEGPLDAHPSWLGAHLHELEPKGRAPEGFVEVAPTLEDAYLVLMQETPREATGEPAADHEQVASVLAELLDRVRVPL